MSESNQHSELAERVKAALAGSAPAPWTWDEDWDTLKSSNGRYVLASRLDFHGKDENGEDDFTSHIDVGDGDELIALAPEIATAYLGLFEQLALREAEHEVDGVTIERLEEQLEAERELRRSADAALEAVGGELEAANARKQELWDRLLEMEGRYLDTHERLEKVAAWYGHDLDAALGSNPAKRPVA